MIDLFLRLSSDAKPSITRAGRVLERELRQAIDEDQLLLHYQPMAEAQGRKVCGFEALVRWRHPERGLIPPMDFIPLAERCGLIGPLGEWVLRKACADAASWLNPLRVAVNLSPLQLRDPALPQLVAAVLAETGLAPERLELEVTESALIDDEAMALDRLTRLQALGVGLAMDDFGAGFSSLATLRSFAFDKLKIDRSFVAGVSDDPRAAAIVRALLGLGRGLRTPVVAEGVETEAQFDFLRSEGCEEVQGFGIGRPAPVESHAKLVGGWRMAAA